MSTDESDQAIEARLTEHLELPEGKAISKWFLVAEVMDLNSGVRQIELEESEGMLPWDTVGMLRYVQLLVEQDLIISPDEEEGETE